MLLQKTIRSFGYALNGISYAFRSQVNMRIHGLFSILVLAAAIFFRISLIEWCVILLCISSVFAAELMNTSLERSIDLFMPAKNEIAGQSKDLAAAAVLVVCFISAVIGFIIFIPKFMQLIS